MNSCRERELFSHRLTQTDTDREQGKDRGQRSEDRGQRSECVQWDDLKHLNNSARAGERGAEVRDQKSEDGRQRTDDRDRREKG